MVSVIIPTFNRATTLTRAIRSVQAQTYTPVEIIVVDDGSTDQTPALIAREFAKIMFLRTPNRGVSAARNLGAKHASGEWLAFLDSDDEWLPHKLEQQLPLCSEFRWLHSEELWIRNGVRVNKMKKHAKSGGRIFTRCVDLCFVSPSTTLIERTLFIEVGGFREEYPVCEDYDLWLKLSAQHAIGFSDEPLIKKYGGHDDQLSRKFPAMDFYRAKSLQTCVADGTNGGGQLAKNALSKQELAHAALSLHQRCDILITGYLKHGNLENLKIVQEWREIALSALQITHSAIDLRPRSDSSFNL